jgi:mannose-6-phosphate isomerase-like protein (cupin superfamily)
MKPRPSAVTLVVAALAAGLSAGGLIAYGVPKIFYSETASATPGVGFTSTILARGTLGEDVTFGVPTVVVVKRKVTIKTKSGVVKRTFNFKVPSIQKAIACDAANPCDTAFQQGTLQPGGTTGWHTHPGPTFVAFAQGDGTVYHGAASGCPAMKIGAGSGFSQMPTLVHTLRNDGSVPIVVFTLYVLPRGTPNTGIRVDQPQPAGCPGIN